MPGKFAGILAFLLALALASGASSEHEVEFRYTVLGYVKDARGKPRPGVNVELVREKTGFSYLGQTDASGLYVIVARLGDDSAGERLRLSIGEQSVFLAARFDPGNHATERGTRLDFLGPRPVERATWFLATLKRFLAE